MKFLRIIFVLFLGLFLLTVNSNSLLAQVGQDRIGIFQDDSAHSPRKATIFSAVLPGLGQAYNKKYWKIPIVYAAIGGCVGAAVFNHNNFQLRRDELLFRNRNNGAFENPNYTAFTDQQLLETEEYYQKWRDNMVLFGIVAYAFNIIDANVDAHLFSFDVSEDLSLKWRPYNYSWELRKPVAGISLTLSFK